MANANNPSGPSQPGLDQVYETSGNAASKEPAEQKQANANAKDDSAAVDQRIPSKQTTSMDEATPTAMAQGVRGAGAGENPDDFTDQEQGRSQDVNAEQMAAPGEGSVHDTVDNKPGAGGGEPGLETDLDRKKAEQAPAREKEYAKQEKDLDVGGVLGQRGGPANPVDKGNYPNSGD
ncbi:hypothetical protein LTR37_008443 [Vermiconidia calcicola]|uniref:Uncharacterized protein n=1 Tax=Vermiconidia calcicola TaxID=1690605 RepID=A0ACC3NAJ1_9PEZI|nr:hypothetical protein LTR37_008443 [Vermiconidia calcicola]